MKTGVTLSFCVALMATACVDDDSRGLPESAVVPSPDGDSPGDAPPPSLWTESPSTDCLWGVSEPPEGELVTVNACVRISPEPGNERGGGGHGPGDGDPHEKEDDGTRCDTYNMLGSVQLSTDMTTPVLMYCDSDEEGGGRIARFFPEEDVVVNRRFPEWRCRDDLNGGDWSTQSDLLQSYWIAEPPDATSSSESFIAMAHIDLVSQTATQQTVDTDFPVGRMAMTSLGQAPGLFLLDMERTLWHTPLQDNGLPQAGLVAVLPNTYTFSTTTTADRTWVLSCNPELGMSLHQSTDNGFSEVTAPMTARPCDYGTRPQLLTGDFGMAAGWDDHNGGTIAWWNDTDEVVIHLGDSHHAPTLAWDGARLWSIDSSGWLHAWTVEGELLGAWIHPVLASRPQTIQALRLHAAEDTLTLLALSIETETVGRHVYVYNGIELSLIDSPLP